jgi:hypothetical protein
VPEIFRRNVAEREQGDWLFGLLACFGDLRAAERLAQNAPSRRVHKEESSSRLRQLGLAFRSTTLRTRSGHFAAGTRVEIVSPVTPYSRPTYVKGTENRVAATSRSGSLAKRPATPT